MLFFINLIANGVVDDEHSNALHKVYDTNNNKMACMLRQSGPMPTLIFFALRPKENLETAP